MKKALTVIVGVLVILLARETAAQPLPWTERAYININGGFESASGDFSDNITRRIADEDATFSMAQAVDSGGFFDFSAGARVWRNVSFGIGFHEGSTEGEASVQGSVPHPLVFNRPRSFNTTVGGLDRSERAIHVQFGYVLIVSDRVSAHVMAGPSFFKLRQDVVSAIDFSEGPGFTSVVAAPTVTERVESPVGFNFGVDVTYHIAEINTVKLGAGLLLRYTGAKSQLELLDRPTGSPTTADTDLGGFHVGLGARVRF